MKSVLNKEDLDYPADIFNALHNANSPYMFYLHQWVPYTPEAKQWRLKMEHDVKGFNGKIEYNVWPNGNHVGEFKDDEVEFIRLSKTQHRHVYEDTKPLINSTYYLHEDEVIVLKAIGGGFINEDTLKEHTGFHYIYLPSMLKTLTKHGYMFTQDEYYRLTDKGLDVIDISSVPDLDTISNETNTIDTANELMVLRSLGETPNTLVLLTERLGLDSLYLAPILSDLLQRGLITETQQKNYVDEDTCVSYNLTSMGRLIAFPDTVVDEIVLSDDEIKVLNHLKESINTLDDVRKLTNMTTMVLMGNLSKLIGSGHVTETLMPDLSEDHDVHSYNRTCTGYVIACNANNIPPVSEDFLKDRVSILEERIKIVPATVPSSMLNDNVIKPNTDVVDGKVPFLTLTVPDKDNNFENKVVGELWGKDGILSFTGNADESAQVFFEGVCKNFSTVKLGGPKE